jgi:transposase
MRGFQDGFWGGPRMDAHSVVSDFRIPDALWERIELLLPTFHRSRKGGRPRLGLRQVIDGIFYVLRTGCQWKAVPREFGSGSSLHRYFQLLVRRGVFERLWDIALQEYDDLQGIDWKWQSMDGAMTKAPLGGEKNREKSDRSSQVGHEAQRTYRWRRNPFGRRNLRREYAR